MKFTFKTLLTISIVATFVSACGAEPAPPTIAAVDVQNTAVAGAFTIVAQTQAAIPTATPLPPTETPTQTPLPTNTAHRLKLSHSRLWRRPARPVAITATPGFSPGHPKAGKQSFELSIRQRLQLLYRFI